MPQFCDKQGKSCLLFWQKFLHFYSGKIIVVSYLEYLFMLVDSIYDLYWISEEEKMQISLRWDKECREITEMPTVDNCQVGILTLLIVLFLDLKPPFTNDEIL